MNRDRTLQYVRIVAGRWLHLIVRGEPPEYTADLQWYAYHTTEHEGVFDRGVGTQGKRSLERLDVRSFNPRTFLNFAAKHAAALTAGEHDTIPEREARHV